MRILLVLLIFLYSDNSVAHSLSVSGWRKMQTYKIIRQTTDFSCGPAALSLLLKKKYGASIEEMDILSDILYRSENGAERNKIKTGFSLLDLKNEVERLGFRASGVKFSQNEDLNPFLPMVILLEEKSYSHFVVLMGIQKRYADLLDPQKGKMHMPLYEFKSYWTGYALITSDIHDANF